jgi:hypothetical protein
VYALHSTLPFLHSGTENFTYFALQRIRLPLPQILVQREAFSPARYSRKQHMSLQTVSEKEQSTYFLVYF